MNRMKEIIQKLQNWGCDIKGALERMLNDEDFYIECLYTVLEDTNFDELEKNLKKGNIHEAFEHAHTLKGVLGNMGLTPMYQKTIEIVEPLRIGSDEQTLENYRDLKNMKDHLQSILKA